MFLRTHVKSHHLNMLVLVFMAVSTLTGCDPAREKIAAAIKPQTAADVAVAVNQKISQQQFQQAREDGEHFLAGKVDTTGQLALAIAKACAQLREVDCALQFIGQALKAQAVTNIQALHEPLLEPVRNDIRFVSLLVQPDTVAAPSTKAQSGAAAEQSAVSIKADGTEVRAGDIVIKLPN